MKLYQVFLRMSFSGRIKVYRIIKIKEIDVGVMARELKYIGTYSRYDKIPKNIRNARICEIRAEETDVITVEIEGVTAVIS